MTEARHERGDAARGSPATIVTVRHGEPDLCRRTAMSARAYGDWWARYDEAGLKPGQTPPDPLRRVADASAYLFSSPLPRAVETAQALRSEGPMTTSADFVEAALPPPPTPGLRLKPKTWGVISRTFWLLGYAPGVETHGEAQKRADAGAWALVDLSRAYGSVLLCAHGYFNWMLDRRLRRLGWRRTAFVGANRYWSYRAYEAPALGEAGGPV